MKTPPKTSRTLLLGLLILTGTGSTALANEPSAGTLIELSLYSVPVVMALSAAWDWWRKKKADAGE
jgi:hypothetical protein